MLMSLVAIALLFETAPYFFQQVPPLSVVHLKWVQFGVAPQSPPHSLPDIWTFDKSFPGKSQAKAQLSGCQLIAVLLVPVRY